MSKKFSFILFPLVVTLACSLLFFTSLDDKVNDLFMRAIPSLTEDSSVLVITVDDAAIENVGIFPWTRDILASAIVFLREMGAQTVVFDLSYLDNSPVRVDPRYVQEELPRYLDNGFRRINENIGQVLDGFGTGKYIRRDAEAVKGEIFSTNRAVRDELGVSIDYVTRDVDAYFADTLQFFGNSWLTLTMINSRDILSDGEGYAMDPAIESWLQRNIALTDIEAAQDARTPSVPGIVPALYKLISRGRGAGFVNADPDNDGYRRRVHLLLKHNDYYYGQLALAAMREMLGNPKIEVTSGEIVLKDALLQGVQKDIHIPRSRDGSMLINWPRKSFFDYNIMSSWDLIRYNRLEGSFAVNLATMQESGLFDYWDEDENPLEKYNNAEYVKEALYKGPDNEDGLVFDDYLAYRRQYLDAAGSFLNGPYEAAIMNDIGDDADVAEYVSSLFEITRRQFNDLLAIRETVSNRTQNAFCIIGVAATSMTDEGLITYQPRYPNVGTYAAVANQIISGEFLYDAPRWVSLALALLFSAALAVLIKQMGISHSILAGIVSMLITAALFLVYFIATRRYLGAVVPFASVTLTFLSLTGLNFFSTLREKSFLRSAFSRYLAPEVINQIIADPSRLQLGGEKRELTAIFTDIQRFSSISEALQNEYGEEGPKMLVNLLNLYLTEMSNIVLANRGTIDKYEGDAIIAFFGAPIWSDEHAALACRSAINMKKREADLTAEVMNPAGSFYGPLSKLIEAKVIRAERPLYTRLGINTGDMVVGNMGTPNKMDYTIMGNAVNLAARLEGVNKQYNTSGILISEYTRNKIGGEFVLRSLDRVRVVGINTPLRLYELLDTAEAAATVPAAAGTTLVQRCAQWEQAIQIYEDRQFAQAQEIFTRLSEQDAADMPAKLYISRCDKYQKTPPPADWDGVFNLTEK